MTRRVSAAVLAAVVTPLAARAQTAHHRFEAFPGGAVTEVYLDEKALGAQNMIEVLKWYVPNLIVSYDDDGSLRLMVRADWTCGRPLLVVDGYPVPGWLVESELIGLNPFQVEKITVFRDVASTSVYGTRAACGAILVTTRR